LKEYQRQVKGGASKAGLNCVFVCVYVCLCVCSCVDVCLGERIVVGSVCGKDVVVNVCGKDVIVE